MKKVLYITILACSTLWGSCTEKNKQSARTDSFIEKNVAFARAQIGNEIQIIEKSEIVYSPCVGTGLVQQNLRVHAADCRETLGDIRDHR